MTKVNSVNVSPVALTMATGDWYYNASASVCPQNADCKEVTWHSDDTSVATVNPSTGYLCAQGEGTAKIYATATDGSGCSDYISLTVKNFIPINMIAIADQDIRVEKDTTRHLSIGISPENATNKGLRWYSEDPEIATVDEYNGIVYGVDFGSATICAVARDNSGVTASCSIDIVVPITKLRFKKSAVTLHIGDVSSIVAQTCPLYSEESATIEYSSSKPFVATVDKNTGEVTAIAEGTTTIKAIARTIDTTFSATCTVTVDPRELVTVRKDGEFFTVTFADGKVWKSIGVDMSLDEYRSKNPLDVDNASVALTEYELRSKSNSNNFYTEKEFALLYLLDPWGVEFYLKSYDTSKFINQFPGIYENYNQKQRGVLKFKDRIYKEIFGVSPTPFVLSDDGKRIDVYWDYDRLDVHTDSELIFGSHSTENFLDLLEQAFDIVSDIILDIFGKIPTLSTKEKLILVGINFAKTLLFTGSIVQSLNGAAVDLLDIYVDECSNGEIKLMEWPNSLFLSIEEFQSNVASTLNLSNIKDVEIYNRLSRQENYHVEFCVNSRYLFVEEIVDLCS